MANAIASAKAQSTKSGAAKLLEYNSRATLSVPQVMEYNNNIYKAMFDQMRLIPGSREFIQKAHKKGFKLGLTTSALQENQQRAFEMFNLWPFFSTIITGQDIINGKPHPEPYLKTAEKLGCCAGKRTALAGIHLLEVDCTSPSHLVHPLIIDRPT